MDIMTYFLIAIIILVVIFAKMALVIIPQSETKIVERLGRYYATLQPGINIIIPFSIGQNQSLCFITDVTCILPQSICVNKSTISQSRM